MGSLMNGISPKASTGVSTVYGQLLDDIHLSCHSATDPTGFSVKHCHRGVAL